MQVLAQRVDVSRGEQVQRLADATASRFGAPNFVFNNAGVGAGGLVWKNSLKDWEWVSGVNLMGVVHGLRAFTLLMLQAAARDRDWRGHIVNTASMAGFLAPAGLAVYVATKFAVLGLSESVRAELQPHGIGVSVLCPGGVQSNLVATSASIRQARPETNAGMQAAMVRPAESDPVKMSARKVGDRVLQAVRNDELYIVTHPEYAPLMEERFASILSAIGESAEPGYADTPAMLQRSRSPIYEDLATRLARKEGSRA